MKQPSRIKLKYLGLVLGSYLVTACSATTPMLADDQAEFLTDKPAQRIDFACEQQVKQRELALSSPTASSEGDYMALANNAKRCIAHINFYPSHPDNKTAMQFTALAVLNYLKAGELETARSTLNEFRQRFPQQDLTLGDYTSFVDTATALLGSKTLSKRQVSLLNINPTLRAELARQQHWAAN